MLAIKQITARTNASDWTRVFTFSRIKRACAPTKQSRWNQHNKVERLAQTEPSRHDCRMSACAVQDTINAGDSLPDAKSTATMRL